MYRYLHCRPCTIAWTSCHFVTVKRIFLQVHYLKWCLKLFLFCSLPTEGTDNEISIRFDSVTLEQVYYKRVFRDGYSRQVPPPHPSPLNKLAYQANSHYLQADVCTNCRLIHRKITGYEIIGYKLQTLLRPKPWFALFSFLAKRAPSRGNGSWVFITGLCGISIKRRVFKAIGHFR